MPKISASTGAGGYYSDAAPAPANTTAATETPAPPPEEMEGEESGSATTIIPTALLAGKEWNPGDQIILEIVQMTEDGALVKYPEEEAPSAEEDESAEEAMPPQAPSPMRGMME